MIPVRNVVENALLVMGALGLLLGIRWVFSLLRRRTSLRDLLAILGYGGAIALIWSKILGARWGAMVAGGRRLTAMLQRDHPYANQPPPRQ